MGMHIKVINALHKHPHALYAEILKGYKNDIFLNFVQNIDCGYHLIQGTR